VRPTRCTYTLVAASSVLLVTGLILEDPGFLLVGASLALIPFAAAITFQKKARSLLDSVSVNRRPETRVIRQGMECTITTDIACSVPEQTRADIHELLPVGLIRPDATPKLSLPTGSASVMTYTLIPLVHGSLWINGIHIEIADRFFRTGTDMTAPSYAGPVIEVLPVPLFAGTDACPDMSGTLEKDRFSIFKGATIRSFREYVPGDDSRIIDWKLSAKYDKVIVREYVSQETMPGLIVLDLPDRSATYNTDEFARLINRVTGQADQIIRTTGKVSILLISGITLADMLLDERRIPRMISWIQNEAYPRNRLYHAYRLEITRDIRRTRHSIRRELSGTTTKLQDFLGSYDTILSQNLAHREKYVFDIQFSRLLLANGPFREILVYSLLNGDVSHVRHILAVAQDAHADSRLLSPVFRDPTARRRFIRIAGSTRLEALA